MAATSAEWLEICDVARETGAALADADNTGHPIDVHRAGTAAATLALRIGALSDYQRHRAIVALVEGAIDAERLRHQH